MRISIIKTQFACHAVRPRLGEDHWDSNLMTLSEEKSASIVASLHSSPLHPTVQPPPTILIFVLKYLAQ